MKFSEIINSLPIGILIVDNTTDSIIKFVNTEGCRIFGDKSKLVGMSVHHLVPDESKEIHKREAKKYLKNPITRPLGVGRDLEGVSLDGERKLLEISLIPIKDEIIVCIIDKHELNDQIKENIKLLKEISDQANKLAK